MIRTSAIASALLALFCTVSFADEGKDESGKGEKRHEERQRKKQDRPDRSERSERSERGERAASYFHQHGYTRIPDGHLPPPGECRIWYPDRPAGHQPPPFKCDAPHGRVEPGGWYMSPGPQPQEVQVQVYDTRRPGIVVDVGIFDARSGAMIRIQGAK